MWDWALQAVGSTFFLSRSSETLTVQRPSFTPGVSSGQSLCGYLHFVAVKLTLLGQWQGPEREILFCCLVLHHVESLSRLACWQVTLSDCLKYQNWHSSTLGHSDPGSVPLRGRPRLASPRLTNNSCLQINAMSAWRNVSDLKHWCLC